MRNGSIRGNCDLWRCAWENGRDIRLGNLRGEEQHSGQIVSTPIFEAEAAKKWTVSANLGEYFTLIDRLCSLVVRVLATDLEVPGSIPGATTFSEK
jgi:hypothetical protein